MKQLVRCIQAIDEFIGRIERYAIVLLFFSMLGVGFTNILYRYVFHAGVMWADELLKQSLLWVGLIGASIAAREKAHLRVDVFPVLLKGASKFILEIFADIVTVFISILIFIAAVIFTVDTYKLGEMLIIMPWPLWIFLSIMPISFFLISVRYSFHLMKDIASLLELGEEAL
jgi:C4-dicarboxylate transporter DctQ subunit